jgi:hypothetical protein
MPPNIMNGLRLRSNQPDSRAPGAAKGAKRRAGVAGSIAVTKTIYYVSASIDGFIAGPGDSLDWLYEIDPGDRDISQFASEVGVVAMGAATYECVLRDSELTG